jgi:adhesin transport system outer membrane protein
MPPTRWTWPAVSTCPAWTSAPASAGDSDRITSRSPASQSLSRNGLALSASQILWDGMATSKEVSRLGHARLTRYFEFLGATEETALEATRAYLDVERYRKLVSLAEDNYVQHKYAFDQLQTKFKAGVGRGVDAEQANARLALAESNLTTEQANLHDVSARYLRIVGDLPTASCCGQQPTVPGHPARQRDTINQALARTPASAPPSKTCAPPRPRPRAPKAATSPPSKRACAPAWARTSMACRTKSVTARPRSC